MKFSLNRYNLIGNIDYNTPFCVIQETMKCLGDDIELGELSGNLDIIISHIKTAGQEIEISDSYTDEELDIISLFVSQKETNWTNSNLIKAFNHLVEFNGIVPSDFTYGPKTDHNPLSYDSTMLYIYCVENNITTKNSDSIDDLAVYTRLSFAKRHVLLDAVISKITQLNTFGIINLLKEIKSSNSTEYVFCDKSLETINKIKNDNFNRVGLTNEEAIVKAAREFSLDITASSCPSREILELYRHSFVKFYCEDNFTRNYSINNHYYNMTKFWKPHLSTLYTEKMLMELLNYECVNHTEISDPKQFLYEITLTKNMYRGVIPTSRCTETFVYKTPIEELNKKHIITYGIINSNDLIVLTPDEISNFFKNHKDFRDFKNEGEIISERNMKKLIMICKSFPQEESFAELLTTIRDIKTLGNIVNSKMKEFMSYCKTCDGGVKERINTIFDKLFHLSMYMRGWSGESSYPLKEAECRNYTDRYEEIEQVVHDKMRDINETINSLPDTTKIIIKSLPLIKLSERDRTYYRSTNYDEGYSFYERLMLISTNPDSVYSCLRLSSNYLASTSQYYNALVNNRNYLDINTLEFIQ